MGSVDVLHRPADDTRDVLIVAVGPFAGMAIETAQRLARQGIGATVVDPRWVLPIADDLVEFATRFHLVVTVEDNGLHGGVGSTLSAALRAADIDIPCRDLGVPQEFLDQGSRDQILRDLGLTAQDIARRITGWVVGLEPNPPAAITSEVDVPNQG